MGIVMPIISYVTQPFFKTGTNSVVAGASMDSVVNAAGVFSPDLTDYTTLALDKDAVQATFTINFSADIGNIVGHKVSVAYVGCHLLTYKDDGSGSPDLSTEYAEDFAIISTHNLTADSEGGVALAHDSQNSVTTFDGVSMPGILSGGAVNVVFNGISTSGTVNATPNVVGEIIRNYDFVTARPHAKFILGHLFIGSDIEIDIRPGSFRWGASVNREQYSSRSRSTISSSGAMSRSADFEVRALTQQNIMGLEFKNIEFVYYPNLYDLIKTNTSYPVLFSPYPYPPSDSLDDPTANATARQGFFSIYGFLDNGADFGLGEYRDGLNTEYTARFRIKETR